MAHVGVLRALEEAEIRPTLYAGSSAGAERHGGGGAEGGQGRQPPGVAPGRDDLARAEPPGDLDGHLPGAAGGAEDEHVLAGLEGHPLAERHPG